MVYNDLDDLGFSLWPYDLGHLNNFAHRDPGDPMPASSGPGAWPVALQIFAQLPIQGYEPSAASVHVAGHRWQGAFLALLEMARLGGERLHHSHLGSFLSHGIFGRHIKLPWFFQSKVMVQ